MNDFLALVMDKQTGCDFVLRVPARDDAHCAERLSRFGFAVGKIGTADAFKTDPELRRSIQQLRDIHADESDAYGIVREANFTEDIDEKVAALAFESQTIDRHFLLQSLVQLAYTVGNPGGASKIKRRSSTRPEHAWNLVEPFAWQWIIEAERFRPHLKRDPSEPDEYASYLEYTAPDYLRKHLAARGFKARGLEAQRLADEIFGEIDDDDDDE